MSVTIFPFTAERIEETIKNLKKICPCCRGVGSHIRGRPSGFNGSTITKTCESCNGTGNRLPGQKDDHKCFWDKL